MLGLMITAFFFGLFSICCIAIFTATGISHVHENGMFYPGLLIFIMTFSSLGVLSAILLSFITRSKINISISNLFFDLSTLHYCRLGQDMSTSYSIIHEHLEKLLVKFCEDMSITERTEIQILIEKFSGHRAPFRQV